MYTTAIVFGIFCLVADWARTLDAKEKKQGGIGGFEALWTVWVVWLVILLVGLARFVNGDTASLGTMGF
jgi:hypothetical protein